MSYRTWLQRCFALAAACGSVSACAGFGDVGGMACPELGGGALGGNFAADAKANGTLRAFVQASGDLARLSAKVEGEVSAACGRIGKDIGLTAAQMGEGSKAKCDAVTSKIDEIMSGGVSLKASFTPPECQVSANAEGDVLGAVQREGGSREHRRQLRTSTAERHLRGDVRRELSGHLQRDLLRYLLGQGREGQLHRPVSGHL